MAFFKSLVQQNYLLLIKQANLVKSKVKSYQTMNNDSPGSSLLHISHSRSEAGSKPNPKDKLMRYFFSCDIAPKEAHNKCVETFC